MVRLCCVMAVCASWAALAQAPKPTFVLAPIEFDPNPSLARVDKELAEQFSELARDRAEVIFVSKKEANEALKELKRLDFRESNESLAKLADRAGSLYALHVVTSLQSQRVGSSPQLVLILTARVVAYDGRAVKQATVSLPKKSETIAGVFKPLAMRLLTELDLKSLPSVKESPVVATPPSDVPKTDGGDGRHVDPPPPMPPVVVLEPASSPLRIVGPVMTVTGAVGVLTGAIVLASAGSVRFNGSNVYADDAAKAAGVRSQQSVGAAVLVAGAAVAAAGGVMWVLAPSSTTTRVSVAPTAGGAAVSLSGVFP